MSNAIATVDTAISKLVLKGDMSALTPQEKTQYYTEVCRSVGLNPATRPFEYLTLNGKHVLYATKGAAEQLRQIHGVSIRILERKVEDGMFMVHVGATDRSGRQDEDIAAVQVANLRGDHLANAISKAITKAKRRVTLSICGLGMLEESEAQSIASLDEQIAARPRPAKTLDDAFGAAEDPAPAQAAIEEKISPWLLTIPAAVAGTVDPLVIEFGSAELFVAGMLKAWNDQAATDLAPEAKRHNIAEIQRASYETMQRQDLPGSELDALRNAYAKHLKTLSVQAKKNA